MKVVLQDFKYGRIMRPGGDRYIGGSLGLYGDYCELEIDAYRQFVKSGDVVLDIGSNIGACTIPLAQMVGKTGRVYAFEPQRVIFQMLCGNVMLNNIMNVYAKNAGIGAKKGKLKILDPYFNTDQTTFNIGSFAINDNPGDYEIEIVAVDDLNLSRCDFIKCDTEGMGLEMLIGAEQTIKRFAPVMYIEQEEGEKGQQVVDHLHKIGYKVYKHTVPLFSDKNYFGEMRNNFLEYNNYPTVINTCCFNWLCVPENMSCKLTGFELI